MSERHDNTSSEAAAGDRTCPNCGRELLERFCPRCGQNDRKYARALGPVAGELFRETFEVDSRLWRTLKLLLFKPGSLTREFSRNRRARYMSPVRLYLAASFLFFLLMSLTVSIDEMDIAIGTASNQEAADMVPVSDTLIEAFKAGLTDERRFKVEAILARPAEDEFRRALIEVTSLENPSEMDRFDRFILPAAIDLSYDPAGTAQDFIGRLPIAMFFMLPLFALALAVAYFGQRVFYAEHLVFAFHVQTVFFLLYTPILVIPDHGIGAWVSLGLTLVPYPYFLIALRRYYQQGWIRTIAKSVAVAIFYFIALSFVWLFAMLVSPYF